MTQPVLKQHAQKQCSADISELQLLASTFNLTGLCHNLKSEA